MVSSAGLSAAYGGYQKARKADNEIQSGDIANQQAQTGLEADTAWGNTIPVLQQMLQPGATPMPPGGAPQASPPGQPSQPMHAPAPSQAGPQSQMLGGPAPPSDPTMSVAPGQQNAAPPGSVGERFGGLPGGGGNPGSTPLPPPPVSAAPPAPQPAQPPMQSQGPQAQQPQQAGRLDLHTIMAAVVKANPGAKPAVIAAAVAKALPLMTAQSQMDYKNLMIQLGNTREQGRNERNEQTLTSKENIASAGNQTRSDIAGDNLVSRETIATGNQGSRERIAEGRNEAAGQRAELSAQTRLAVSTLSNETRRDIADVLDKGRTGRAELSAASKAEIAKLNTGTRREIATALEEGRTNRFVAGEEEKGRRQNVTEVNRNARFTEGETQKNERQGVTEVGRNTRQGVAEQGRADRAELSANTKSDIARMSVEARRELQDNLEGGRNNRATLSASTRAEVARLGAESRAEIASRLEEGRNTRNTATLESRGSIATNKEQGLNERQETRNQFLSQRIELQNKNLDRQLARDGRLEDNARNRQTLKLMEDDNNAEFKRAQQKIAAQNVFAPNKSKEKLTQDAETAYQNAKQRIEQYRTSMGGKGAGGDTPPVESLKEGHVTTFDNGQKWTLQGGKPVRVPGPQSSLSPVNEQFPGAGTDNPMDRLRTRHFQRQRRDVGPTVT